MDYSSANSYEAISCFIESISRANNAALELAYNEDMHFHNSLGRTVVVVLRSGKRITIPSSHRPGVVRDTFVIRKSWSKLAGVKVDHPQLSNAAWNDEITLLTETHAPWGYNTNVPGFDTDYSLTLEDLVSNGSCLYIEQLDIVVAIENPAKEVYHPRSIPGLIHSLMEKDEVLGLGSKFIYGITIVDRRRLFGEKYVNINGVVYPVDVITGNTKYPDGVYLLTSGAVGKAGGARGLSAERMSFSEAKEKLLLYNTYDEALVRGNYDAEEKFQRHKFAMEKLDREREEANRAFELKRLKDELDRADYRRRLEEALTSSRLEAMKHERAKVEHDLSMKAMERKDQFEEKSFWRKSMAEAAKYLPAIVGALVTAGLIVLKVRSK